jgi:hypothetical protein
MTLFTAYPLIPDVSDWTLDPAASQRLRTKLLLSILADVRATCWATTCFGRVSAQRDPWVNRRSGAHGVNSSHCLEFQPSPSAEAHAAIHEVADLLWPNARERAIRYTDRQYGRFEQISLTPYK